MQKLLASIDEDRVRAAIAAAEERTAGEIVPCIVPQSEDYEVAVWRGAALAVGLVLVAALLVFQFYAGWGLAWLYTGWGVALVVLAAGTAGALATAFLPPLKRLFAGVSRRDRAVHRRALEVFIEEEVFDTRDRTGILLFVSLFEHRIEVVGDAGINAQVDPDEWADVVARIRKGIKDKQLTDGVVDAIGQCGRLLERRGVEIQPDDENELSDRVRISDSGEA